MQQTMFVGQIVGTLRGALGMLGPAMPIIKFIVFLGIGWFAAGLALSIPYLGPFINGLGTFAIDIFRWVIALLFATGSLKFI